MRQNRMRYFPKSINLQFWERDPILMLLIWYYTIFHRKWQLATTTCNWNSQFATRNWNSQLETPQFADYPVPFKSKGETDCPVEISKPIYWINAISANKALALKIVPNLSRPIIYFSANFQPQALFANRAASSSTLFRWRYPRLSQA